MKEYWIVKFAGGRFVENEMKWTEYRAKAQKFLTRDEARAEAKELRKNWGGVQVVHVKPRQCPVCRLTSDGLITVVKEDVLKERDDTKARAESAEKERDEFKENLRCLHEEVQKLWRELHAAEKERDRLRAQVDRHDEAWRKWKATCLR